MRRNEDGRIFANDAALFRYKNKYKDSILFYRLGDFYEMFFDDAITVSRELELTLTGKDCGQEERAPMCGIPYHAADNYIAKLIGKVTKWQFVSN